MAEGMDLTPDTTCWSRISAIIAGRSSYINHKKPEHGKPRPPNTNHIYGYKKRDSIFRLLHLTGDDFFFFSHQPFLTLYTKTCGAV